MMRLTTVLSAAWFTVACSDTAGSNAAGGPGTDAGGNGSAFDTGEELRIPVSETGRIFVSLSSPEVVAPPTDPKTSLDWDLAFEGFDVFTNSGPSGNGEAAAFGPLDAATFVAGLVPAVPFLVQDKAGGAFLDWYAYEGSSHALWSRYHVFGVKDGARLWKVQILGYYGERDGATIPALYRIRYAELGPSGASAVQEPANLDGTAGGADAPKDAPSECLDLGTGVRTMLTPAAAQSSMAWHLCFRRASIGVNGEMGGPRGVGAVDLDAAGAPVEKLDAVKARTSDSEKPLFDAVTDVSFDGRIFRGDRVISTFGDNWVDREKSPLQPLYATWVVLGTTSRQKFLVGFTSFDAPTAKSPGVVAMRVKPVKG